MEERKHNKENKKEKGRGKGKGKKDEKIEKVKKRILNESNDSDEADECFCIVCGMLYKDDLSGGDWIQCISCKEWAQAGCIKGDITSFLCLNCDSDDDEYE